MNTQPPPHPDNRHHSYEFCFPQFDTLLQVDESEDGVVVLATRDTFSERRKVCFIHELAAEGFIDDRYQWFSEFGGLTVPPVRWRVDYSWLKPNKAFLARTRRFMFQLLAGAALLWLTMLGSILIIWP